ncbi:MAG: SH3 domain-containing protein [Victivallaceae bacterium]
MQINSLKKTWLIGLVGAATIFSTPFVTMAEFVDAPTPQEGVVSGNDVNVRVAPNRQIICTMKNGEKVKIIASDGEWLKIAIPADAKTYIAGSMIENGKTKSNVNVRSGPGVEFPSYGILPRNSVVTVQPLPGKSDWSKINPPDGLYAYISANFVKHNDFTKSSAGADKGKSASDPSGNNNNKNNSNNTKKSIHLSTYIIRIQTLYLK